MTRERIESLFHILRPSCHIGKHIIVKKRTLGTLAVVSEMSFGVQNFTFSKHLQIREEAVIRWVPGLLGKREEKIRRK